MTATQPDRAQRHDRSFAQTTTTLPIFLTVRETAAFLRLSEITLSRWRTEGGGPPYRKFGRRVLYARTDLVAWAEAQTRLSTSQPYNHSLTPSVG